MKFSFRQILASAGGAVLAAVIASLFGVRGTIVGVAIGSAAATFGTAFLAQSIERGHEAVKQVVVRVPENSTLLRRLGGTQATGVTESAKEAAPTAAHEAVSPADPAETAPLRVEDPGTPDTMEVTLTQDDGSSSTQVLPLPNANPFLLPGEAPPPPAAKGMPWSAIAGTAAIVFVLSLMFVTAVELIAGRPLADLFGGHSSSNAPSVGQIFNQSQLVPTSTTTTTTTTIPPSTTTSTSTSTTTTSSTTSTTAPTAGSTTTLPGSTTTTGGTGSTTTSTSIGVTTTTK